MRRERAGDSAMPRNHSPLRQKLPGGNHAGWQKLRLRRRFRCGLRIGLGWGWCYRLLRPERGDENQIHEKT